MTQTPSQPEWRHAKIDGFMGLIGPVLSQRQADGAMVYGLNTGEAHQNLVGLVHGGVITSLIDQAIALVAWKAADRRPVVTVQMDVKFMTAAKPGSFLQARATIRHTTRHLMFVDAQVHCDDVLIASASAIMKISDKVN